LTTHIFRIGEELEGEKLQEAKTGKKKGKKAQDWGKGGLRGWSQRYMELGRL
jgi:hypothetical protein